MRRQVLASPPSWLVSSDAGVSRALWLLDTFSRRGFPPLSAILKQITRNVRASPMPGQPEHVQDNLGSNSQDLRRCGGDRPTLCLRWLRSVDQADAGYIMGRQAVCKPIATVLQKALHKHLLYSQDIMKGYLKATKKITK